MKLYRPVLIESAEQAEALPTGTLVNLEDRLLLWTTNMRDNPGQMIGWTALVPIEARRQEPTDVVDRDFERAPSFRAHRYCTPWMEEV